MQDQLPQEQAEALRQAISVISHAPMGSGARIVTLEVLHRELAFTTAATPVFLNLGGGQYELGAEGETGIFSPRCKGASLAWCILAAEGAYCVPGLSPNAIRNQLAGFAQWLDDVARYQGLAAAVRSISINTNGQPTFRSRRPIVITRR